jgi:hypothetical protein
MAAMSDQQISGVVCQWCERVIRPGGDSLALVTCLQCASTFGASFRRFGHPVRRGTMVRRPAVISTR